MAHFLDRAIGQVLAPLYWSKSVKVQRKPVSQFSMKDSSVSALKKSTKYRLDLNYFNLTDTLEFSLSLKNQVENSCRVV